MSKIPLIGDIPILGNLFKSSSFQKQETELMFIITADLVKPVNSDELPQMKGVDGLKNGSPLGVEAPGGDGISGRSGFSSGTESEAAAKTAAPATVPATTAKPATTTPAAPANGAPANDSGAKTAPQPVATPGATKGATP
jgi:pilus assembly protein CpaC